MSISSIVVVSLSKAVLCFSMLCHPALVGIDTPVGQFHMTHVATTQPGYHGDVLMYKESKRYVWAIHRLWLLDPKQRRAQRILSPNPKDRVITMGCINLQNSVYASLVKWVNENPNAVLQIDR